MSDLLLQYDVKTEGKSAFLKPRAKFVSNEVRRLLKNKLLEVNIANLRIALMRNDGSRNHFDDIAPVVFEKVVGDMLVGGVKWKKKLRPLQWDRHISSVDRVDSSTPYEHDWTGCELEAGERVDGELIFSKMKPGQICISVNLKYPFVDFYTRRKTKTKNKKQELILFQVTRQKAEATEFGVPAMVKFFKGIGLAGKSLKKVKIRLVLVPHPARADKAILVPKKGKNNRNVEAEVDTELESQLVEKLKEYEVWRMPVDYSRQFYLSAM